MYKNQNTFYLKIHTADYLEAYINMCHVDQHNNRIESCILA